MASKTTMSKMQALVDRALDKSGNADRYHRRMKSNPTLAKLGFLPQKLADIANHDPPWFCHGLAFRMATYASDDLFGRWETLLKLAAEALDWKSEYARWNNIADHWAKKWDRFHHFLWLLQCYEYFSLRGLNVSFTGSQDIAMPDLVIRREEKIVLFVESYYYSKWWPGEHFLDDLLRFVDPHLSIERTLNVASSPSSNPFSSDAQFTKALDQLATALTPYRLAELQAAAQQASPQKVFEIGDIAILLEGPRDNQSGPNAHGDSVESWSVFVNEIITAKVDSNNLKTSRPNLVMVNGLGLYFQ